MTPLCAADAMDWRPTATPQALRQRASMLAQVRAFFAARGVLEVDTPILSAGAVTDPQIESLSTQLAGAPGRHYLSTSPEFAMKRLLAAGVGDVYQVCKVFRDEERGRWHNPEFTMIEWYRGGMDDHALMTEVEELVATLFAGVRRLPAAERLTYAEVLERHAGVDPFRASDGELGRAAEIHGVACEAPLDRDARLDLLMALVVAPKLGVEGPCFVCDYPASQASLARIKPGEPRVAARFELYLDGVELANGFHELTDAEEQHARFSRDLAVRREQGRQAVPLDRRLLAALAAGMPDCAGVAVGFDRLVSLALGAERLADAMAFPIDRA